MRPASVQRTCLVIPTGHHFVREVLRGALRHLRAARHAAWHLPSMELLTRCPSWVDGFIVSLVNPGWIRRLQQCGRPVVNVSTHLADVPFPSVVTDNRAIGRLAAEHFLEHGHRWFGYLPMHDTFFSRERYLGFLERISALGLACEPIVPADTPADSEREVLHGWLQKTPKPVAVLAANDERALDLLRCCEELRVDVPAEVAIMGVGNDEVWCELTNPPLSSIDQNAFDIGYQAASWVLGLIAGQEAPKSPLLIPPRRIVLRDSTGSAAWGHPEVGPILRFLWDHVHTVTNVEQLLRNFPMSRRRLELLFREHVGRSPARQIKLLRVERAKALLAESNDPLKSVALRLGFRSFSHFAGVFRRQTGMTPGSYRRRNSLR